MIFTRRVAPAMLATVIIASGVFAPIARSARPSADEVINTELMQPVGANWANVGGNLTN